MSKPATAGLRFLVACRGCGRQYDASELPPTARFHCYCGDLVVVPRVRARDAAVVRCSACGSPREQGDTCAHCGAGFTLHERDMHTLCPECMTRVSDRARFCHHCGTGIKPQAEAGRPTEHPCPACGTEGKLTHRTVGRPPLSVLECPRCAGLWLGHDGVDTLLERARLLAHETQAAPGRAEPSPHEPTRYRRCPLCDDMMSRLNFGRRSGVIIDRCNPHGVWFDARELEAVLSWVRHGGEERATRAQRQELRAAATRERFAVRDRYTTAAEKGSADTPLLDLLLSRTKRG